MSSVGLRVWTPAVTAIFVAANLACAYYIVGVAPHITQYEPALVQGLAIGILCLGLGQVLQFVLLGEGAPTGKFGSGAGTQAGRFAIDAALPVNIAWWTMEQPSFLVPAVSLFAYWRAGHAFHPGVAMLGLFMLHYLQRAFIYPWLSRGRPYPAHAWISAMCFTACNGTMQANDLLYGPASHLSWSSLASPRVCAGAALFLCGMAANVHADWVLRNLRKPGETAYKVPRGGLFEYVSGANFVAEVFEWSGYGLVCLSLAPLAFSAFNWLGIGTRAIVTHQWYLDKFGGEYPAGRKRLIPFVW